MLQQQRTNSRGEKYVIGPTGAPLTLADLPPAETQRWVIRRKGEVVAAVRGGLLSLDEACDALEAMGVLRKGVDRQSVERIARIASSLLALPRSPSARSSAWPDRGSVGPCSWSMTAKSYPQAPRSSAAACCSNESRALLRAMMIVTSEGET